MVSFNGMIPTVGKDQFGNATNLLNTPDTDQLIQARNIKSVGASESTADPVTRPKKVTLSTLDITSIYSKDNKTLALGKGVFSDGSTKDLAYSDVNGGWVVGLSPITTTPRYNGIAYSDGNFVVATTSKSIVSDFKYNSNTASGTGIVNALPTKLNTIALGNQGQIDNLSASSTTIVAGSLTKAGTWITKSLLPANEWGHNVGEQELKLTNSKSTSYTFPGYAKANPQIQRACALPNGDSPPIDWTTGDGRTNGYYGVIGGPVITTTWTK